MKHTYTIGNRAGLELDPPPQNVLAWQIPWRFHVPGGGARGSNKLHNGVVGTGQFTSFAHIVATEPRCVALLLGHLQSEGAVGVTLLESFM